MNKNNFQPTKSKAVIAGYVRSPFTPAKKGSLAKTRPDDIATSVVNGLLENTGIDPVIN